MLCSGDHTNVTQLLLTHMVKNFCWTSLYYLNIVILNTMDRSKWAGTAAVLMYMYLYLFIYSRILRYIKVFLWSCLLWDNRIRLYIHVWGLMHFRILGRLNIWCKKLFLERVFPHTYILQIFVDINSKHLILVYCTLQMLGWICHALALYLYIH